MKFLAFGERVHLHPKGKRLERAGSLALAFTVCSAGCSTATAGAAKAEHGDGPATAEPPACPACLKPMTRRVAKQGARVGEGFWGCTGFPSCRGTRPLP
jgi:ssDNA-binding Zn-finger/Zn-ribbon topoisomerase 1